MEAQVKAMREEAAKREAEREREIEQLRVCLLSYKSAVLALVLTIVIILPFIAVESRETTSSSGKRNV